MKFMCPFAETYPCGPLTLVAQGPTAAEPEKKTKKKKKGKVKESNWAGEVKLQRNAVGVR